MAAKKNSPSVLASGLGMAMAFIQALVDEIVALGGFEEMLHFLTTERGQSTVRNIAKLIVNSEWRIPRSLVEKLAAAKSKSDWGPDSVERDRCFWWDIINLEATFKIPVTYFNDDRGSSSEPVPQVLRDQIVGKPVRYPMVLEWQGEPHVIVNINTNKSSDPFVGATLEEIEALALAPAKYFDLER